MSEACKALLQEILRYIEQEDPEGDGDHEYIQIVDYVYIDWSDRIAALLAEAPNGR